MSIKRYRIDKRLQLRLAELFVAKVTARTSADLVGLHRNSAALFYHKLRELIANRIAEDEPEPGVFECDEIYLGGIGKGKRGRGAAGKVCVFGILKRGGKVYALPVADASGPTLLTALKTKVLAHSVVYTHSLPSYSILDIAGFRHRRVNHGKTFVTRRGHHINGIEFSGISQRGCCANIMGSLESISFSSLRNANSDSTMELTNNNLLPSESGLKSSRYLGQPQIISGIKSTPRFKIGNILFVIHYCISSNSHPQRKSSAKFPASAPTAGSPPPSGFRWGR